MTHDSTKHNRRSIRLPSYDYAQPGAYFITICTQGRECVLDDAVVAGIIGDVWRALPAWFPSADLDEFVIMPNHVHFVLWLLPPGTIRAELASASTVGGTLGVAPVIQDAAWKLPPPEKLNPAPELGDVIGAFKSLVFTVYRDWIQAHDSTQRAKFWQRNYYEHVIRGERELEAIRRYIRENPAKWELDPDNPRNLRYLPCPKDIEGYLVDIGLA
jgi:putative transposase